MFTDPAFKKEFQKHAKLLHFAADSTLIRPGEYIKAIPIVIKGCIRILRQNQQGEETFLYHVMPGETCAMSLTCCSSQKPSEVKAIFEEDTDLWAIPIQQLEEWQEYKEWRDFISTTYQTRFDRLLQTIDDIAFQKMDERMWHYLLARAKAKDNFILHITHEEIAQELNIQREAATRLIKKLKDMHYIETGRNMIRIIKKDALV